MIRTALLLARTSLLSVLFLAAALLTLVSVLSDTSDDGVATTPPLVAALAPMPKGRPEPGDGPAALRIALFDPERRPDTVAGSIDDLRNIAAPPPPPVDVVLSGILIDGAKARVMLGVTGGPAIWSDVGSEIGGWRVARIDPEGAVLEHDGRSLTLTVADRWKARDRSRAGPTPDGSPASPSPDQDRAPSPVDTLVAPDPVEPAKP